MREFFEQLARRAAANGESSALVTPDGSRSYGELMRLISAFANTAKPWPKRIGLLFRNSSEHLLADLALSFAGKELVPLPEFFSDAQLAHIIKATELSGAVTDDASIERARRLGLRVYALPEGGRDGGEPADSSSRIIFTSGTTGVPKGVRLSEKQLLASVAGLSTAARAGASDRYLSILPQSLLLEQVAGIYLPLSVGASIHVPDAPTRQPGRHIRLAAEQSAPTATVLVPELLAAWFKELKTLGQRAPSSLRFIAVGGAPLSRHLADAAWSHGLPVYEGYGLSECGSVVSVNCPDARRAGTVGRPLDGVQVTIVDGEVVVGGRTVMFGYLGEAPISGSWHTGDLGSFDADGFLRISGRKDNVIVTAAGRNVSPEWVEEVLASNPCIQFCVVVQHESDLAALIVPQPLAAGESPDEAATLLRSAVESLPAYARPQRYLIVTKQELLNRQLLTANGRPRRRAIRELMLERAASLDLQPVPA